MYSGKIIPQPVSGATSGDLFAIVESPIKKMRGLFSSTNENSAKATMVKTINLVISVSIENAHCRIGECGIHYPNNYRLIARILFDIRCIKVECTLRNW